LERVASDEPAPGGGAAAAVSAALAAGLVAMTARLSSRHLDEPETVMAEAALAIARVGAALASLASLMSTQGNPNLRGDAFVAVVLADAATTGAARLVELNVRLGGLDRQWVDEAR